MSIDAYGLFSLKVSATYVFALRIEFERASLGCVAHMCSDDQETRSARADMFLAFAILAKDR